MSVNFLVATEKIYRMQHDLVHDEVKSTTRAPRFSSAMVFTIRRTNSFNSFVWLDECFVYSVSGAFVCFVKRL